MENLRDFQSEKTTAKANADQLAEQRVPSAQMAPPMFQLQASEPDMEEAEESSEQDSLETASDTEASAVESIGETEISSPIQSSQADDIKPFQLRTHTPVPVSPLPAAQISAPPIQSKISPELEEIEEAPELEISEKIFSGAPMPPEDPDAQPPSDNNGENTGPPIIQQKQEQSIAEFKPFQLKQEGNEPAPSSQNDTGLPDSLKSGIESLSGSSLDDVKVHYNSSQPAQFQAHAYAQGTDIHVAPGQEQHLAHEAWHVVQQKQGRVSPTTEVKEVLSPTIQRDEDTAETQKGIQVIADNEAKMDPGNPDVKRITLVVEGAGHLLVGGLLIGAATVPSPISVLLAVLAGGQFLIAGSKFLRAALGRKKFPRTFNALVSFEGMVWAGTAVATAAVVAAAGLAAIAIASAIISAIGGFLKMVRGGVQAGLDTLDEGSKTQKIGNRITKVMSVFEAIFAGFSAVSTTAMSEGAKAVAGIFSAIFSVIKGVRGSGAMDKPDDDEVADGE